jgi:hypothetical protein
MKWYITGHATGHYWEVTQFTEKGPARFREQYPNGRISSPYDTFDECMKATLRPESERFK